MNLWTEYEGRTIDGAYRLTRLIRPEGRSAFFSTSNGTGVPTVIRLIESHFDGDEILSRWRGVETLNHSNLVQLKSFGREVVDETQLVYAVFEPVDANLGEMLRERALTEEETRQVATSLLAAIEALHANGFVHEHVEPGNVLAVGEVIKLRSDCIRETLEGADGVALKKKDVRDYATVLLEALTRKQTLEDAARDFPLPSPFEQIVRKGISGEWGLEEIGAALAPPAAVQTPTAPRATVVETRVERPVVAPVAAAAASVAPPKAVAPSVAPVVAAPVSVVRRPQVEEGSRGIGRRGIAYGVGALLIVLLAWYFVHSRSTSSSGGAAETAAPAQAPARIVPSAPVVTKSSAATVAGPRPSAKLPAETASAPRPAVAQDSAGDTSGRWRVIAFTYNQEDQAQHKVAEIARSHPDLNPSVFTLTGHAPFLVTLGGQMSREDAFALSGQAKREGLPKDVYAQNYRYR
jgi:eukaryotic-like serine/threonine-protein kinase